MEVCFILQYVPTGYTHGGMLYPTINQSRIYSWRYASSYNMSIQDILLEVGFILKRYLLTERKPSFLEHLFFGV